MYSPQVGSPVAFYTLHFEPQSGGDLKRFSVIPAFYVEKIYFIDILNIDIYI